MRGLLPRESANITAIKVATTLTVPVTAVVVSAIMPRGELKGNGCG
jgi:hypothetical protein